MFREIEPAVAGLFEGRDGVVLTYGATSSGKSHTIIGSGSVSVSAARSGEDQRGEAVGGVGGGGGLVGDGDGILPRALERMYQQVNLESSSGEGGSSGGESSSSSSSALVISVRAFEVYNNKLYDLLNEGVQPGQHLSIQQGGDGKDVIQGFREEFPPTLAEALACARSARGRAQVNRTNLNESSSRGHVIFVLGVHRGTCKTAAGAAGAAGASGATVAVTDLYVCDLAGPERQNRAALADDGSGSSGLREAEAREINLDITEVFRLWKKVRDGARSVVIRGRVLTRVLKSLFVRPAGGAGAAAAGAAGGGMSCVMMVCLNPAASEYQETDKVLKNLLISSKVKAPVEESVKRRRRSPPRAAAAGGAAGFSPAAQMTSASARGRGGRAGTGNGGAAQASGAAVGEDQGLVVVRLREEIQRLLDEKARMEEDHEEEKARMEDDHEVLVYDAEKRAKEEEQEAMQELEVSECFLGFLPRYPVFFPASDVWWGRLVVVTFFCPIRLGSCAGRDR